MLVKYNETYTKENIEACMEQHLYDAPKWYLNDYVTLEKKANKYYVYMFVPTNALNVTRYTRKWRLFFTQKGIRPVERLTFISVAFFIGTSAMGFSMLGALLIGEMFLGVMALIIFALFFGIIYVNAKKNLKDFLQKKMQE